MTKRKKRLEKGISSLDEQIKFHEEKLARAKTDGDDILERYYEKEIEALRKTKQRKENQLEKN